MAKRLIAGKKVLIIAGKYKNTEGVINRVFGDYVTVSGVPKLNRAVKANPRAQEEGGFKGVERKIHCSNVKVIEGVKDE